MSPLSKWRKIGPLCEFLNQGAETPSWSQSKIRRLVAEADTNGLRPYVRRVGGNPKQGGKGGSIYVNSIKV